MSNIPGNPANYPANIRAPGGADNRNATTEDAAFQDLADRTAYLHGSRVSQHQTASPGDMQALTGMASGDVCYVQDLGYYRWWGTSTYTLNEPFIYPSLTAGAWVYDSWELLLTAPTDTTIRVNLTPQSLLAYGSAAPGSNITYSNSTSTTTTIVTTTIDTTGLSGKTLRIAVSGLVAKVTGSFDSNVDVLLTFDDSSSTTHTAGSLFLPGGAIAPIHVGYDFTIPDGATTCVITVRGTAVSGDTLSVTGLTTTQWLQWSIIQIPS